MLKGLGAGKVWVTRTLTDKITRDFRDINDLKLMINIV